MFAIAVIVDARSKGCNGLRPRALHAHTAGSRPVLRWSSLCNLNLVAGVCSILYILFILIYQHSWMLNYKNLNEVKMAFGNVHGL